MNGKCSPHLLTGHDEGSTDVAVLDETFSVRQTQLLSRLQRRHTAGVRDRYHHINLEVLLGKHALDFDSQRRSHRHARAVDGDTVEDRVGSGEVDVLENVGSKRPGRDDLSHGYRRPSDDDGLTRADVLPFGKSQRVGDNALTGHDVVIPVAVFRLSAAVTAGADAVGIPEGDDSESCEHGDTSVRALGVFHQLADGSEDVVLVDTVLAGLLQVVGEDVEEDLGIRVGVDMTVCVVIEIIP